MTERVKVNDTFTKRNHYNPCSWTALWNQGYFEALKHDAPKGTARTQHVSALGVRANKVYSTILDDVHFMKDLGVAEITPESARQFCLRWFPDEYESFARETQDDSETLYLDFEDTLTAIENIIDYGLLIEAAMFGSFSSVIHKGFVTCLLVFQAMRSYEMMTSMVNSLNSIGISKWEYFWLLKNAWANKYVLARAAAPLAFSRWTLYRTHNHRFPLCDSPVMINLNSVMVVLSPRMLIEIELNVASSEEKWVILDGIRPSKYNEFRRRSIANTFQQIIFHDPEELERWRATSEFQAQVRKLSDSVASQRLIADAAARVKWCLYGFGRMPENFEALMERLGP